MYNVRFLIITAVFFTFTAAANAASVTLGFLATVDRVIVDPSDGGSLPSFGTGLQQGDTVRGTFSYNLDAEKRDFGSMTRFSNVGGISVSTPLDAFTLGTARIDLYNNSDRFGDRFVFDARGLGGDGGSFERRVTFDLRDSTGAAFDTALVLPSDILLDAFDRRRITLQYTAFTEQETRERSVVSMTIQNLEAVPLPASALLLAFPVLGMVGLSRRRRRTA
ncbi:MAG: hypothetical protein QNJ03_11220 [Dinoroseobacter sp.]|nr:hypothetical protein [Dinoroseobacter sp.]